jgi:hypothetical protein
MVNMVNTDTNKPRQHVLPGKDSNYFSTEGSEGNLNKRQPRVGFRRADRRAEAARLPASPSPPSSGFLQSAFPHRRKRRKFEQKATKVTKGWFPESRPAVGVKGVVVDR